MAFSCPLEQWHLEEVGEESMTVFWSLSELRDCGLSL